MLVAPARRSRLTAVLRKYGGHHLWRVAGADLGAVFIEDDVADPVQLVFDAPVVLDPGGEGGRWRGVVVGGGDDVDDLDALAAGPPARCRSGCASRPG